MAVNGDLYRRLCRARDCLCDDIDASPDLRALARLACVSPFHFLRVFRQCFSETPHEYLTRLRIERAKASLRQGKTVTETCFDVGYASVGSFSSLFRRQVGVAPIEYQRSIRLVAPSPGLIAPLVIPYCFAWGFAPSANKIAILEKPLPFRP